ncbi:6-phospho-3-hexuloisomerase [Saccharopolyspora lacisalsi]|uniref:6-phospho-3-hexuloisomerase n=1 Tax=Halosaccharopolyspora lacisalsi TaxID=1000566 RepID=A0A839DRK1_9PSEU|nr:6-phospho-3-hexuloisomerase [Halosaccharopolyspora lacisalsi]MBA8823590.1 6-phospho-3-hexuloisomerase [Halosaccharopolyspora lacisalsi]
MTKDALDTIQAEISGVLARVDRAHIEEFVTHLAESGRVLVTGAGRSGFMASAFAMRLVHLGWDVHVVGEATAPALSAGDTLVAISGSGTTSGTVRTAEEATRAHARVLAVTTDEDSPLARSAERVLCVPAATKHRRDGETSTVQPLSSLFDQVTHLVFDAVCLDLAQRRGIDNTAASRAHVTTE